MVANAKAAVPTVGDNAVAMQLSTSAQNTAMALIELKNAAGKVIGQLANLCVFILAVLFACNYVTS